MKKLFLASSLLSMAIAGAMDLVKDGKPAATIVIPQTPTAVVKIAVDDFIYHIERISGAKLQTVNDVPEGSAIVLKTDNEEQYKPLGRNGFIIKDDGNKLVISASAGGQRQALYYLLEEKLGVRWLWPGPLGEVINATKDISFKNIDVHFTQPMPSSRWHLGAGAKTSWKSQEARENFYNANFLWMDRLGFDWDTSIRSQHSFGHPGWKYGEKYWKTHPEYFNMLPDGTRRPDPYHVNGAIEWSSTCPSSVGLLQQVLKDWREKRADGYPFGPNLFLGENDANGSCCCPDCLAADHSDDAGRLQRAKARFEAGDPKWTQELGDVSDRYMQFYLKAQAEALKTDPNVKIIGWADYANYHEPPKYSKLNDGIVLCFVGRLMYPWTNEKLEAEMESWDGWSTTGAKLVLRPNFMLDGHCMPINFARKLYNFYQYCFAHNMIGTEFDSNIGQFGGNGFNYYVLGRITRHPELSFEDVMKEYCDAFGGASEDIREYWNYWEKISDSQETIDACKAIRKNPIGVEVGGWNYFYTKAPLVYTPEVIAHGKAILAKAASHASGVAAERVEFLRLGLENASLTLDAQRAYEAGDKYALAMVVKKLDDFRESIEDKYISDMAHLLHWENDLWDRTSLEFMLNAPGTPLKDKWRFAFDPEDIGEKSGWFKPDFDDAKWDSINVDSGWEMQPVGAKWREAHNNQDYDGPGWYRFALEVPPDAKGQNAVVTFGAADEACRVWVNGKLALDRPYPYQGDDNSWATPFTVNIGKYLNFDGPNLIAVRVMDTAGQGGIWRPVYIEYTPKTAENIALNPDFESNDDINKSWPYHAVHGKYTYGLDKQTAHTGKCSYKMTCTEVNVNGNNLFEIAWMRVFQNVKNPQPGKYYFSAWFKTDKDYKGQVRIWVLGDNVKQEFTAGSTDGNWMKMEFKDFQIPENTKDVNIYLNVLGGLGSIWFDDVQLSRME